MKSPKDRMRSIKGGENVTDGPSFFTTESKGFEESSKRANSSYTGVSANSERALGGRDAYKDYETNTTIREQFTRTDYENFRPNEAIAKKPLEIIGECRNAYKRVGVIRNVMDLMSDFGSQGARVDHPNAAIQKFYRGWWKKVDGNRICERFLNLFYREGVSVIKRTTGTIPKINEKQLIAIGADKKTKLEPEIKYEDGVDTKKRNIPLRYTFLNPLSLKALDPELSQFVGKTVYSLTVSRNLAKVIKSPKTEYQRTLVNMIPEDIKSAVIKGETEIALDPNKVVSFFYKKDDWQAWADPMTYAIMDDLKLLEKMKLADLAALDGAISQIRLWKLGDIDKGIFPTEAAVNKLSEILSSNPGGGAFDIIWGPELSIQDYKTDVHQFLGKEKYEPVWNSIYEGLGVPPSLTGAASSGGKSDNFISLKTLVQRLEYGRDALRAFWEKEFEIVGKAMGFKVLPKMVFDNMVLADEAAEKALLIQLADRDVISIETLVDRFGEIPEIEEMRLRKENKARKSGKMTPKTSPWHKPEKLFELMKIALTKEQVTPQQAGLNDIIPDEFMDMEPFAVTRLNQQMEVKKESENDGVPQQGRPLNSKDTEKRDERTPNPTKVPSTGSDTASFLTSMMWAKDAYGEISDIVNSVVLQHYNKKSLTALSSQQSKESERIKFSVLSQTKQFSEISREGVYETLKGAKTISPAYLETYESFKKSMGRELSLDDRKTLQISTYAVLNC